MNPDPIDDLARALPPYRPAASRVEQVRTAVLAGAPALTPARPTRRATYAAVAVAALAAAAALIWIARRPAETSTQTARIDRHGTVVPLGEARFELGDITPDETVRVRDGVVRVTVTPLGAGERFRILTDDAEVEVRGTEFDVEVRADHIQSVACASGVVEVRPSYAEAVLLEAGERWDAPKLALVETPVGPTPVPEPVAVAPDPEPAKPTKTDPPRRTPKVQASTGSAKSPIKVPVDAPGEAEFRAGWAALKAGDPADAADSFAAARQAKGSAVAEDASFWEGIALARAGKSSKAIAALRRFVNKYPSSSRAGEAAAKLGWLLHDAGDLATAERYFNLASNDVVPKVQKSARDGLESIARKRAAP